MVIFSEIRLFLQKFTSCTLVSILNTALFMHGGVCSQTRFDVVLSRFDVVLSTGYRLKQSTLWLVFKKSQGKNYVFYEVFTGVVPPRGFNANQ